MKKTLTFASYLPVLVATLGIGSTAFSSCKKKEEDAPPPLVQSVAPTPPPAPTPVAVAPEEDAAVAVVDDAGPKKVAKGAPADVAGLRACCTALKQNAASMPPPNNAYAMQAATMCEQFIGALAAGALVHDFVLGPGLARQIRAGSPQTLRRPLVVVGWCNFALTLTVPVLGTVLAHVS